MDLLRRKSDAAQDSDNTGLVEAGVTRRLIFGFTGALLILAMLSAVSYGLLRAVIEEQRASATVISVASRQATFAHRIAVFSSEYSVRPTDATREDLLNAINEMEYAHLSLTDPKHPSQFTSKLSPVLHKIYFGDPVQLDAGVKSFLAKANEMAAHPERELVAIDLNKMATQGLLVRLEKAVAQYTQEAEARVDRLTIAAVLNMAAVMITLLFVGTVIFRPLVRYVRGAVNRLVHWATFDSLTGLLNRRGFFEACEGLLAGGRERSVAVIMIDLDHFKHINDTYGHAAGDETLREVGRMLSAAIPRNAVAGRLGGEEFGVVVIEGGEGDGTALAASLRAALSQRVVKFRVPGAAGTAEQHVTISASLGVFVGWLPGEPIDAYIKRADKAVYIAKSNGRDQVVHAPA